MLKLTGLFSIDLESEKKRFLSFAGMPEYYNTIIVLNEFNRTCVKQNQLGAFRGRGDTQQLLWLSTLLVAVAVVVVVVVLVASSLRHRTRLNDVEGMFGGDFEHAIRIRGTPLQAQINRLKIRVQITKILEGGGCLLQFKINS